MPQSIIEWPRELLQVFLFSIAVSVITRVTLTKRFHPVFTLPAISVVQDVNLTTLFIAAFEAQPFPDAFKALVDRHNATYRESLYRFVIRFRFEDFVKHWRQIPPTMDILISWM
jgi:hypothetical protein